MALVCGAAFAAACAGSGGAPAAPARSANVAPEADVQAALTRTCYGCHSAAGVLSWHAKLAPSAWFAGSARAKLDFSTLQSVAPERRAEELHAIERVVRDGEMPPWDSALFDATAKLSPAEKAGIARWASETASR